MIFSSSLGKKIDTVATWTCITLCLTLLAFTGAGWAAKDSKRPSLGRAAPAFILSGLNSSDSVSLADLRGKVVFIDFWASWCLPCRQLMPRIAQLKARHPDIEVIAISVDANRDKAITFLRAVEPSLRAVHDGEHQVADAYGVERMPSSFLIDKEGKLRFRHEGYSEKDIEVIERQVRLLLEE
jgi:thiol-disulfide isomerase/thioredoxin